MTPAEFRKEYICEPAPLSDEERRAIGLWCWYFVTVEAYDQKVCTGSIGGVAMPANGDERATINANANLIRGTVLLAGCQEGIPRHVMIQAAKVAGWMTLAEQERLAVGPRSL